MKNKRFFVNLSGILLAFVIAFGGIFAVWTRLSAERKRLLSGSGKVEIPVRIESETARSIGIVDVDVEVGTANLTQEELCQAVQCLESASERYPHEPEPVQLSMTEAVKSGMAWIEDFFLPHLDREEAVPKEYRMGCYLWAGKEEEDEEKDPLLGYWEVSIVSEELDAVLLLNAVTGQVLRAQIALPSSGGERPGEDSLSGLLEDYADSFGIETDYVISAAEDREAESPEKGSYGAGGEEDGRFWQRLENDQIAVCLEAGDSVSTQARLRDGGGGLCFSLYLETSALGD